MENNELIKYLLSNYKNIKTYKKNEIIFNENELCNYLGIVISGKVQIVSYSYNGNELIFKNLEINDIFGESLIFSSTPYYKAKIVCKSDCKIAYISKDELTSSLLNEKYLKEYLKIVSDENLLSKEKTRVLSFDTIKDRLLYLLTVNKEISYKSISSLASKLCVSRESLSREITFLQKNNLIIVEDKTIKKSY